MPPKRSSGGGGKASAKAASSRDQILAQLASITATLASTSVHTPQSLPTIRSVPLPRLESPEDISIPAFHDWKQRWADFVEAQQLLIHPISTQQATLRSALHQSWTLLWSSGRISIEATTPIKDCVAQLETYLRRKRNPLLDRQAFHRRDQQTGESIDQYYAALKSLDDACAHESTWNCSDCGNPCETACTNFGCEKVFPLQRQLQDIRIRDRLICGLRDSTTQHKILTEQYDSELSLERVLSICTAIETSTTVGAALSNTSTQHPEVYAACRRSSSSYRRSQLPTRGTTIQDGICSGCGATPKHPRKNRPALEQTCKSCGVVGHYARVCKQQQRNRLPSATAGITRPFHAATRPPQHQANMMLLPPQAGYAYAPAGHNLAAPTPALMTSQLQTPLYNPAPESFQPPRGSNTVVSAISGMQQLLPIETFINGSTCLINWLADPGADPDLIPARDFFCLEPAITRSLKEEKIECVGANGIGLDPIGSFKATLTLNGRLYSTIVGVCNQLNAPLLSKRGCIALGLIPEGWPHSVARPVHLITQGVTTGRSSIQPQQLDLGREKQRLIEEFNVAFDDTILRPMEGPPMSIKLVEGAVPCKRYRAYTIPFHWQDKVKAQIDVMVQKGVAEPVPVGEPIDWCHPMVAVPKKGSSEPRLTVDLTGLNKYVRRPAYPVRVPREVVSRIPPGMRYFTTLDARHGYWQVPLDEASRKLTTFITPWGCYRYCRNVMGLCSAGDEHNRRGDEALSGIPQVEKVVEDIIVYDSDYDTHVQRVKEVLARCLAHGITLNLKKFVFAQPEVEFCGFRINFDGYRPAPHLVSALRGFPIPTSKTDVRSFNGLVQQFEAFSSRIAELASPIRSLLSSSSAFVWLEPHQTAFENVINELCSERVLAQFHPTMPLRLETDAAQSRGLGYALYQQQQDGLWRPLQLGSRYVTPAESRYSATEVELLAVVWAIKKCRLFLLGTHFELVIDHRPLLAILNSKYLDEIENTRILRLKEKLIAYRLTALWRPGKKHTVVDLFSRYPAEQPSIDDIDDHPDEDPALLVASVVDIVDGTRIVSDPLLLQIRATAQLDDEYRKLRQLIPQKIAEINDLDADMRPFWKVLPSLTVRDELIFLGSRILIPKQLRPDILRTLHASHQGQDRTLRRARQAVFWPGITNDIRNIVSSCQECAAYLPSQQQEPLLADPPPSYPFQEVSTDLFSFAGYEYLVLVDRYSGWINVAQVGTNPTASTVIRQLKLWMCDFGIPEKLVSDNGPKFHSQEFAAWASSWKILHEKSSPHYPQSNGLAESAVKAIKYLVGKSTTNGNLRSDAFQLGLMELRNTPRSDGRSPAQLVFGAPTRTLLPLHRGYFAQEWKSRAKACDERAERLRMKATARYNSAAKPLPPFSNGQTVLLQDHRSKQWSLFGEILEPLVRGRSYLVRTESGRVLRRNRRFLRPFLPSPTEPPTPVITPTEPRRSTRARRPNPRYVQRITSETGPDFQRGHEVDPGLPQTHPRQFKMSYSAALFSSGKT